MIAALPPPPPALVAPAPERSASTIDQVRVAAAMTDARVRVDSSFSGASIVLYGAVFNPGDQPTDVVVVVRGPDAPVRLVKKTRNMGVWLNSRPVVFEGAPGFYMTASTRPLGDIADFGQLRRGWASASITCASTPRRRAARSPATACATWSSAGWARTTSTGAAR